MTETLTIRYRVEGNREALRRLAELDGRRAPDGPALLAYEGDELVAAVGIEDGRVIADPFRYTTDVVNTLVLRAAQQRDADAVHPLRWLAVGHRVSRWGFTA
jgi:hypothetical protein